METHPTQFVPVNLDHRQLYIGKCKENVASILKDNKVLIRYIKNRHGQRVGVLVAAKPQGSEIPMIGWSLCKVSVEPFNKYIGLIKAFARIEEGCPFIDEDTPAIPNSIGAVLPIFEDRIKRYFKTEG
jgi:hypothetical protein